MKLAITFAPSKDDWQAAVNYAVEAERHTNFAQHEPFGDPTD